MKTCVPGRLNLLAPLPAAAHCRDSAESRTASTHLSSTRKSSSAAHELFYLCALKLSAVVSGAEPSRLLSHVQARLGGAISSLPAVSLNCLPKQFQGNHLGQRALYSHIYSGHDKTWPHIRTNSTSRGGEKGVKQGNPPFPRSFFVSHLICHSSSSSTLPPLLLLLRKLTETQHKVSHVKPLFDFFTTRPLSLL